MPCIVGRHTSSESQEAVPSSRSKRPCRKLFLQHRGQKKSVVRKVVNVLWLQKQDLSCQGMEQQILPFYVQDMHKAASADLLIFCRFLLRTQQHAGARVAGYRHSGILLSLRSFIFSLYPFRFSYWCCINLSASESSRLLSFPVCYRIII